MAKRRYEQTTRPGRPARRPSAPAAASSEDALLPGRARIRQLQQSLGNHGVARLLSSTSRVQRQGPSLLDEGDQLTLDPDIMAQMRAIEALQGALTPAALRPSLLQLPDDYLPPPGPMDAPATPQSPPLVPAGNGPAQPRAASGGDLLKGVMAIPTIDTAITNLRTRAVDQVRRDWSSLSGGGQAAVVTSLTLIGGSAIAGAMTDPDARQFALNQLNGRVISVPGLSGLGVELNTEGDNVMVGLHLDVGRFLPESLGFGPGSPTAIGAPPGR